MGIDLFFCPCRTVTDVCVNLASDSHHPAFISPGPESKAHTHYIHEGHQQRSFHIFMTCTSLRDCHPLAILDSLHYRLITN